MEYKIEKIAWLWSVGRTARNQMGGSLGCVAGVEREGMRRV